MDKEKFVQSWNNVKEDTKRVMFAGGYMDCTAYLVSGIRQDEIELYTVHGEHAEHAVFVGRIDPGYILEVK